jgi:hypothetical protein
MKKVFSLGNIVCVLTGLIAMGSIVFASGKWKETTVENQRRIECLEKRDTDRDERERDMVEKINNINANVSAILTYIEIKKNIK